jgi:hypothetical protein
VCLNLQGVTALWGFNGHSGSDFDAVVLKHCQSKGGWTIFQQRLHLSSTKELCRKTKHCHGHLTGWLGFSFCINCNLYGYNCRCFLRIFLPVDSVTCSSRLDLDTDFLEHQTKLSHTLSMVSSVMLGLPVQPFCWWQMQRLSQNSSYLEEWCLLGCYAVWLL